MVKPSGGICWKRTANAADVSREAPAAGRIAPLLTILVTSILERFVINADCFDATLFGYSRQEAESIRSPQRLLYRRSGMRWSAGYARRRPHKTGVFASSRMSTYPGRSPERDRGSTGQGPAVSDGQ